MLEAFTDPYDPDQFKWLKQAACDDLELSDFFVEAGHVISSDVVAVCRTCPVRQECITHAYEQKLIGGYFGGMSPSKRKNKTLEEALAWAAEDTAKAVRRQQRRRRN